MNLLVQAEDLRNHLAKVEKYKEFKETYKGVDILIRDLNSSKFWNFKNRNEEKDLVLSPIYKNKISIILKLLQKKHGNLLDVGLGTAEIEQKIQNSGLNIFRVDISDYSIENAKFFLNGVFRIGNIFKIPFDSNSMDFVLALDILEHLPIKKIFRAYKELLRVLKKDGKVIISVLLNEGLDELLRDGQNPNGHLMIYTPDIIRTELKLSGMGITKGYYLYAFNKFYFLKSLFVNFLPFKVKNPNLMIIEVFKQ